MALMLSRPRNPPANTLLPSGSIRLTHQVKFSSSLGSSRARNVVVAPAVDVPHVQRRPRVHRRVDVAEVPLVGRERAVRVLEPLAAHHQQLVLGERRVDVGQRDRVEGQVPRGEPRVLPRVGHRQDVPGVHVGPAGVAAAAALAAAAAAGSGRRRASASRRSSRTACPRSSRRTPAGRPAARRRSRVAGITSRVELVGLAAARLASTSSNALPNAASATAGAAAPAPPGSRPARPSAGTTPRTCVPVPLRVHRRRPGHDVVVDAVLGVRRASPASRTAGAALVSLSQNSSSRRRAVRAGVDLPLQLARAADASTSTRSGPSARSAGRGAPDVPGPGVAEPQVRQHVQRRRLRARRS